MGNVAASVVRKPCSVEATPAAWLRAVAVRRPSTGTPAETRPTACVPPDRSGSGCLSFHTEVHASAAWNRDSLSLRHG